MSSEMRIHHLGNELQEIVDLRSRRQLTECEFHAEVAKVAKELALLARTEAGADGKPGSVAKRKRIELEARGYVVNGVCFKHPESGERGMLCNGGSVHWLTRPQDASGDAEDARRYRWLRENRRAVIPEFQSGWDLVTYVNGGEEESIISAQTLDGVIDIAMQAKEAK